MTSINDLCTLQDRELAKFMDDADGNVCVNVCNSPTSPLTVTGTFTNGAATSPTITNLDVPTADTEVSHAFQAGLKKFLIRARGRSRIQFAFVSTESGTKYITIKPNTSYYEQDLNLTGVTLYLQTSLASEKIEILEWT